MRKDQIEPGDVGRIGRITAVLDQRQRQVDATHTGACRIGARGGRGLVGEDGIDANPQVETGRSPSVGCRDEMDFIVPIAGGGS